MSLTAIVGVLVVTLVLALWGIYDLASGWEQRRMLAARSVLGDEEGRMHGLLGRLDSWLRRTDIGRAVARRIVASGLRIRVSTFLLLMSAAIVGAVFFVGSTLAPVFGVLAAAGVAIAFFGYLRHKEDRRREEFIAQLPELARVLSNASSAGLVLRTAIDMAADELAEPARTELRRTSDALKLGQPIDQALHELGERLPSRELAVLVSTLMVSARSGGSLVTALRNIATTLDDRKEIRREVRTIMGEAVVSNWAVGLLGVGAVFIVNAAEPGVLRRMSETFPGQIVLLVSVSLFIASLVIIRRITRVDV